MSFFSDPAHLWIAVLVMAGTTVVTTAVFTLVVKTLLDQFLKEQEKRLVRATIQTDSVDIALSEQSKRIDLHAERLGKLEQHRHDHSTELIKLGERLARIEPRK